MVTKKDTPPGEHADSSAGGTTPTTDAAADATAATTANAAVADEAPAAEGTVEQARERHADTVIRNHVLLSAAAAVIPVAFVDTAALAVVQLRLLKELSEVYEVDFRGDIGKSAVGTLLGAIAPSVLSNGFLGSMAVKAALHSLPVVGTVTRLATQPALHAAFTYALGKVFQQHFASGGTFLTFEPEKVKAYFRQKYAEARNRKNAAPEAAAA